MVKGLVRNQWVGWEGAPKTYYLSTEFDLVDLMNETNDLGRNAVGINLLSDEYGAFRETELILSYSYRIQVSAKAGLRLGLAVNFNSFRLDATRLTTEQSFDPRLAQYGGGIVNMDVLDFNIGMSLIHPNYYISYGVHNVNQGGINNGEIIMDKKPQVGIGQVGYRTALNDQLTLISNGLVRSQIDLPTNLELNLKFLFNDKFWFGMGHRFDYSNNAQLGLLIGRTRFGYVYEWPKLKSYLLPSATHEFMMSIRLFNEKNGTAPIW